MKTAFIASLTFCFALIFNLSVSNAQLATFDFESVPGDGLNDGTYTFLTVTNSGLSIDIMRSSGLGFDVLNDDLGGFPDAYPNPGWGDQALSPFFAPSATDFFVANMSFEVDVFGFQYGDFGGDTDNVFLNAWSGLNGTGTLLASTSGVWTNDFNMTGPGDGPQNLAVFASGINSVTFGGGSFNAPNSVFIDNFRVSFTQVPEPSALCLLGVFGSFAALRRKRNLLG